MYIEFRNIVRNSAVVVVFVVVVGVNGCGCDRVRGCNFLKLLGMNLLCHQERLTNSIGDLTKHYIKLIFIVLQMLKKLKCCLQLTQHKNNLESPEYIWHFPAESHYIVSTDILRCLPYNYIINPLFNLKSPWKTNLISILHRKTFPTRL